MSHIIFHNPFDHSRFTPQHNSSSWGGVVVQIVCKHHVVVGTLTLDTVGSNYDARYVTSWARGSSAQQPRRCQRANFSPNAERSRCKRRKATAFRKKFGRFCQCRRNRCNYNCNVNKSTVLTHGVAASSGVWWMHR